MTPRSWLHNLFAPRARTIRNAPGRWQPAVEALEGRDVPTTITVNGFVDGATGDTLRAAVRAFNADPGVETNTIQLVAGTYALTLQDVGGAQESAAATGDLDVTSTAHTLVIRGNGSTGPDATVIDAGALNDRVFQIVNPGTVVRFENLVIRGGSARDDGTAGATIGSTASLGGGVLNGGGNVTFQNVVVDANVARGADGVAATNAAGTNGQDAMGGGLYSTGGTLTLEGSTFSNNQALGGNGGNGSYARTEVPAGPGAGFFINFKIQPGGTGGLGQGGGLYVGGGSVALSQSTVTSNTAQGGTGGIGGGNGSTPVDRLYSNMSGLDVSDARGGAGGSAKGGGIFAGSGVTTSIDRSTFSSDIARGGAGGGNTPGTGGTGGNGGNGEGGGLAVGGPVTITNSSLESNSALGGQGGDGGSGGTVSASDALAGFIPLPGGAGGAGGAARGGNLFASGQPVVLTDTPVSNGSATDGAGGRGGAGTAVASGKGGVGNTGGVAEGGGVYASGSVELTRSNFSGNTAQGGAGGSGGSVGAVPSRLVVAGNGGSAGNGLGGGLYVGGQLQTTTTSFTSNTARGGNGGNGGGSPGLAIGGNAGGAGTGFGGGLYGNGGSVLLSAVTLDSNVAQGGDAGGLGVSLGAGGSSGSAANGASGQGGGIYSAGGAVTLTDSTVEANDARGGTGSDGLDSRVSGAGGAGLGGGLLVRGAAVTITGTAFTNNTATGANGSNGGQSAQVGGYGGQGGQAQGGGLYVDGGQVTITGSTLASNAATAGSGGNGSEPVLTPVGSFGGDAGNGGDGEGGGLYVNGSVVLDGTTVSANLARGGANGAPGAGVTRGGFNGIAGAGRGGGLYVTGGSVNLADTTLASNSVTGGNSTEAGGRNPIGFDGANGGQALGGGLYASGGPVTIVNTTVASNTATGGNGGKGGKGGYVSPNGGKGGRGGSGGTAQGGGLYLVTGTVTINNATLSANVAQGGSAGAGGDAEPGGGPLDRGEPGDPGSGGVGQGGGLYFGSLTVTLNNSIVAGSAGGDVATTGGTLGGSHNLIQDGSGGLADTIVADPKLGPLADNGGPTKTIALLGGSPALDAGDSSLVPPAATTDQRGTNFPRIRGTSVDLGAVEERNFALSNSNVVENQPAGTTVGTFSSTDSGGPFTYTLVSGDGDTDNASFTVGANGNLKTIAAFDFEAKGNYSIRVRITDAAGLFSERQFTVSVTNADEAPTDVALSNSSTPENQPVGTVFGTFSSTDPDSGDTFTYTLVSGDGDNDNASFTIDANGNLKTAAVFDFEAKGSYSVRVRTTDAAGLFFEKPFAVTVTNSDEAPTNVTLSNNGVTENQPAGTTVGTLTGTDPDSGDTFVYTLVSGAGDADNASFTIDANGDLRTTAAFDFEVRSSYSVRVRVTDAAGLFFEKPFTITVTGVNEGPQAGEPGGSTAPGGVAGPAAVSSPAEPFPGFRGEIRTTRLDVTGDGVADLIYVALVPGSHVKVFDGATGAEVRSLFAFPGFVGSVSVGAGDVNADGTMDLIVGTGAGAPGGHVKVFDGRTGTEIRSFFAFPGFRGGVSVASGDVTGDGVDDILVGAGAGAPGGHVKVFDGATGAETQSFFAFPDYLGGVNVGSRDVNGDGVDDILVGATSPSHVKAFDGVNLSLLLSSLAFDPLLASGVLVG